MKPFVYSTTPCRVIFGRGARRRVADEISRLGCQHVLVLSTAQQKGAAEDLAATLGSCSSTVYANAEMHTPVAVTNDAMQVYEEVSADGVVSLGGGTAIGLGKAIAYRNGAPQLVLATTYAGSEVTPILGQTEDGVKTTVRGASILPETVIYDPDLTLSLPIGMSITSGLNAIAHAVEALYSSDRNPISSLMALEGVRALHAALPRIVADPADIEARSDALYGAWLCGTVLGAVGMALHHKLCHVLGGSFNLPHAEVHSVILPYSVAYNAGAAAEQLAPLCQFFGDDIGAGLKMYSQSLGAPQSLSALGMLREDVEIATNIAMRNPYANPQPLEHGAILDLIASAWSGGATKPYADMPNRKVRA